VAYPSIMLCRIPVLLQQGVSGPPQQFRSLNPVLLANLKGHFASFSLSRAVACASVNVCPKHTFNGLKEEAL
jgi:hypothetical protein